ncbi:MAG: hypothetical protein K0R78_3267 [Pelosinus sp.]|jgi:hypothetical protein|nr:hypothetical protein [Pelosinus sp.]
MRFLYKDKAAGTVGSASKIRTLCLFVEILQTINRDRRDAAK